VIVRGRLLELGKREKGVAKGRTVLVIEVSTEDARAIAAHLYGDVEVHAPGHAPADVGDLTVDHAGRPAARSDQAG
jgi:hypothetical protein